MKDTVALVNFFIVILFFLYVYKLENEKCVCSRDWRRDFIKYYTSIVIARILIFNFLLRCKNKLIIALFDGLSFMINIFGFIYLWSLYNYSVKLKKESCECSNFVTRDVMIGYSSVVLVIYLCMLSNYVYQFVNKCL